METARERPSGVGSTTPLDDVLAVARALAGRDAIGGLHVALAERPSYEALAAYRRMAAAAGLSLTLRADTIDLEPLPTPAIAAAGTDHGSSGRHADTGRAWRRLIRRCVAVARSDHSAAEGRGEDKG